MKEKSGVIEMPLQYLVAVIISLLSLSILLSAFHHFWQEKEVAKAIHEVNRIVKEAERIYYVGENGSIEAEISIPSSVKKVIFSYNNQKNCYCIIMRWHQKIIGYSKAKFTYSQLYPGKERIIIKLREGYIEISQ